MLGQGEIRRHGNPCQIFEGAELIICEKIKKTDVARHKGGMSEGAHLMASESQTGA